MIPLRAAPSVLPAIGLLLLLSACGINSAIDRSHDFARLGDYPHAIEVLQVERDLQLADGEVEPELEAAYQDTLRRFLLDRARRRIFQEREDDALRDLAQLEKLDPNYPELDSLRRWSLFKQAKRVVEHADGLLSQKDYEGAMKGYIESQRLVPGFELADEGMTKVREELARLSRRAQQQFLQAVRKVPEFRHIEVEWHAANVIHNTPDIEDEKRASAVRMRAAARAKTAEETLQHGLNCERANQFGAALILYRTAQKIDPELEGAEEAIVKMEKELEAVVILDKAQIDMRNGKFKQAQEQLEEAFEKSTLSRGQISELMIQARELEGARDYQNALDLQVMGKKTAALAAFEKLGATWPDGLEDEQARIASLKIDIEGAMSEWVDAEAAEAAGDLEEALDHYISAERYYAEWRDGEKHIERLRAAIKAKSDTPAPAESGEESGGEG